MSMLVSVPTSWVFGEQVGGEVLMIKRREFIALLGGAAAAWPPAARAQQSGKLSRIGFLGTSSPSLERHVVDALRQKLRELGHVEGENIAIEFQWAEGQDDRLPSLAAELVRLKPDVIVTTGTPGTLAAKQATSTIPIVFASSGNPVNAGLVATYARPGGNVTGFTILGPELEGKRVQLLKEAVPGLSRVALLWNPANPGLIDFYHQSRAAAAALDLTLRPVMEVRGIDDFKDAFSTIASAQPQAMIVNSGSFLARSSHTDPEFRGNQSAAGNVPVQGLCRRRGTHVLCAERHRPVSPYGRLCGQNS
jgi:putative tryptophan/tyrosine transport system substrate-binding protein